VSLQAFGAPPGPRRKTLEPVIPHSPRRDGVESGLVGVYVQGLRRATMRAIAIESFGAPARTVEVPRPQPAAGEILVRVSAAGVNPYDWKIADGALQGTMPHVFPLVLGIDAAGVVEALGEGTGRFRVGDRVFGQFLHSPVGVGTYAEYATVPESIAVSKIPPSISPEEAAALPTAGMTALQALDELGLRPKQTLLVVGATGGVGSFATQLAAAQGIEVVALARPGAAEYARSLRARATFDYTRPSVLDEIRSAYPEGLDGLLDTASDAVRFRSYAALLRSGGAAASTRGAADAEDLGRQRIRASNTNLNPTSQLLDRLAAEVVAGRARVPVAKRLTLAEIPSLEREIRSGPRRGKIVIVA
jgi:NADPH:quinone reductase-like Zn-dependent oxidoreductase